MRNYLLHAAVRGVAQGLLRTGRDDGAAKEGFELDDSVAQVGRATDRRGTVLFSCRGNGVSGRARAAARGSVPTDLFAGPSRCVHRTKGPSVWSPDRLRRSTTATYARRVQGANRRSVTDKQRGRHLDPPRPGDGRTFRTGPKNRLMHDMRTVYARNPAIVLREEDPDGGLLLDPATNRLQVLNGVGLFLWSRCDGTLDRRGLVDRIRDAFSEVPAGEVDDDVGAFLDAMTAAGFVIARELPER